MEYAVIETGGKQYKVARGDILVVEKLPESRNGLIDFNKVLLYVDDSNVRLGKPYLSNLVVRGKVLENFRGEKIRVAKFRAKSRYRKVRGYRQMLSRVQIDKIIMK